MSIIYLDNDHVVSITSLKDEAGNVSTGATVTMTLYKADGTTEVSGETWPVTLSEGDPGDYSAQLSEDVSVAKGDIVKLRVVAENGGRKATWWSERSVQTRTF